LIAQLGITDDEELVAALRGILDEDKGYVALARNRKRDIDLLRSSLASARRQISEMRIEINALKGFGKTPNSKESKTVSADPPPDG